MYDMYLVHMYQYLAYCTNCNDTFVTNQAYVEFLCIEHPEQVIYSSIKHNTGKLMILKTYINSL